MAYLPLPPLNMVAWEGRGWFGDCSQEGSTSSGALQLLPVRAGEHQMEVVRWEIPTNVPSLGYQLPSIRIRLLLPVLEGLTYRILDRSVH